MGVVCVSCCVVCICCVSACAHWESHWLGLRAQLPREALPREVRVSDRLIEPGLLTRRTLTGGVVRARHGGDAGINRRAHLPCSPARSLSQAPQPCREKPASPVEGPPRGSWGPTGFSGPQIPRPCHTWGPGASEPGGQARPPLPTVALGVPTPPSPDHRHPRVA